MSTARRPSRKRTAGSALHRKLQWGLSALFSLLTIAFIVIAATVPDVWAWLWERHHNELSWYIRPLLLIPFCVFSWRRNLAGVTGTVFLLMTSMAWFPPPAETGEHVREFLRLEQEYLQGSWDTVKIGLSAIPPLSLTLLSLAFWHRSLWLGLAIITLIAVGKVLWGVVFAGDAASSVLLPAGLGFVACTACVVLALRSGHSRSSR